MDGGRRDRSHGETLPEGGGKGKRRRRQRDDGGSQPEISATTSKHAQTELLSLFRRFRCGNGFVCRFAFRARARSLASSKNQPLDEFACKVQSRKETSIETSAQLCAPLFGKSRALTTSKVKALSLSLFLFRRSVDASFGGFFVRVK